MQCGASCGRCKCRVSVVTSLDFCKRSINLIATCQQQGKENLLDRFTKNVLHKSRRTLDKSKQTSGDLIYLRPDDPLHDGHKEAK